MAFKLLNELLIYSIWYISKFVQSSLLIKNYICHEYRRQNLSIRNMEFYLMDQLSLVSRRSMWMLTFWASRDSSHPSHLGRCRRVLPALQLHLIWTFWYFMFFFFLFFFVFCFFFFFLFLFLWISLFCTPNPSWLSLSYIFFV